MIFINQLNTMPRHTTYCKKYVIYSVIDFQEVNNTVNVEATKRKVTTSIFSVSSTADTVSF